MSDYFLYQCSYVAVTIPPFQDSSQTERQLKSIPCSLFLTLDHDHSPKTTQKIVDVKLFYRCLAQCVGNVAKDVIQHVEKTHNSVLKKGTNIYFCEADLILDSTPAIKIYYRSQEITNIFNYCVDMKDDSLDDKEFSKIYNAYLPLTKHAFCSNRLLDEFLKIQAKNGINIYSNLAKKAAYEYLQSNHQQTELK